MSVNTFGALGRLAVGEVDLGLFRLEALEGSFAVSRLPYSLKVLLENLLRHEDGEAVSGDDIEALARWSGGDEKRQIAFRPTRVLLQDFTGVPALVDLAAMRDAVAERGGDPARIELVVPADLVIDHSVSVDVYGRRDALARNYALQFERNRERYKFLRWGQQALAGLRVVPPATGICHQVNLEYLATVVASLADIKEARVLAVFGDTLTTDHISPAGSIDPESPAGRWLIDQGVAPAEFNSYGSRRGNHEVMMRGTFANRRIRNRLVPGSEGGITRHLPDGQTMTIYEAAMRYASEQVPLVILAGKEYGSGSSRDWAAKGTALLGVRAVLAESFERIHRSNLVGMGVLPLRLLDGDSLASLAGTGAESVTVSGLAGSGPRSLIGRRLRVEAAGRSLTAVADIETPMEAEFYAHGGILPYVLRQHWAAGRI